MIRLAQQDGGAQWAVLIVSFPPEKGDSHFSN